MRGWWDWVCARVGRFFFIRFKMTLETVKESRVCGCAHADGWTPTGKRRSRGAASHRRGPSPEAALFTHPSQRERERERERERSGSRRKKKMPKKNISKAKQQGPNQRRRGNGILGHAAAPESRRRRDPLGLLLFCFFFAVMVLAPPHTVWTVVDIQLFSLVRFWRSFFQKCLLLPKSLLLARVVYRRETRATSGLIGDSNERTRRQFWGHSDGCDPINGRRFWKISTERVARRTLPRKR